MILYTFQRDDSRFDFMQLSPELAEVLYEKDQLETIADVYHDERGVGVFKFLVGMGVSPSSIRDNLNIIYNMPMKEAKEFSAQHGQELEESENVTIQ